jgi:hypothetical protein
MATLIAAIATIAAKYNVTLEQMDKATHCSTNGEHFYIVESQSEPNKEYHVKYNSQYNAPSCTCKAGTNGRGCWHKRAALAAEEYFKATERARRLNEQATVEATEEYQLDQLFNDLEEALDALDRIAEESDRREQSRRDADRSAYLYYELALGI